ncbi:MULTISPECIES: TetR/AcrR family transcriptional regulator [Curtobacterium]|uniref:TetR/AcrR family transcriptional regulator n=1 Tax=Curtobacterium TaxID=2034 RepID=UPI0005AC7EFF|nr:MULTISPECIES: TetR/AcrR family transcriptional regulator [Curtobacterium]KIQ11733.1 TetR family transcriptional regulator [Curtobacterium flaccumfaciens]UXZ57242.1 TetR/AcrR family transcriptional regulator [Curtobacterium sp. Arg-1]
MVMRPGTEQRLLDAAEELFFSQGIAATPIDAVLERAGVSTATLYRGYASKEALVAAALTRRHDDWIATWDRAVAAERDDLGRLLAVFDALDDYRSTPTGSRWCAFLGTAAEYADAPAEVRQVLDLETTTLRQRLVSLAAPVVGPRAEALADQLLLIVSGSLAMRLRDPALDTTTARSVAASLIREHTTPDGTAPTP